MKDFQYVNSCRIVFGKDKVSELNGALTAFGRKVLFVYGQKSIKTTGLYDRITGSLETAGIDFVEHGGVRSNPVLSHAVVGIELAKTHKIECVLAVGGGSVIDEAKVIAFGALSDADPWSFFINKIKPDKALPIVTVPTIAGTGSEMNSGAVLTNENTKEKLGIGAWCLFPRVSILDPSLTMTVSKKQTIYGLADAFSHVLEGYFNGEALWALVQDEMAEGVLRSIMTSSLNVLADPENYVYRSDMMWSACLAHNGILNAGRGKIVYEIHCVAHVLGALFDIPHGAAISIAIPAWMRLRMGSLSKKMEQLGKKVFGVDQVPQAVKQWLIRMGAETSLGELGIDRGRSAWIIEKLKSACLSGGMRDIGQEQVSGLVASLY